MTLEFRDVEASHTDAGQSNEFGNVKTASKRRRQRRSLTVEQFKRLSAELHEPHRTIEVVCICFGLRISEALALRWSDVDWLNGLLRVERGIVERNVDDEKTGKSRKSLAPSGELLDRLKVWKQGTEISADGDWIFASPAKLGRIPYSYTGCGASVRPDKQSSGLGHMGTHTFRHSYRMWIEAIGTPIGVQQKPGRHSDIRTTINIYGDAALRTCVRHTTARLSDLRSKRCERHGKQSNLLKEWLLR